MLQTFETAYLVIEIYKNQAFNINDQNIISLHFTEKEADAEAKQLQAGITSNFQPIMKTFDEGGVPTMVYGRLFRVKQFHFQSDIASVVGTIALNNLIDSKKEEPAAYKWVDQPKEVKLPKSSKAPQKLKIAAKKKGKK